MATDRSVGSKAGEIIGGTPGYEADSLPEPRPVVMAFARAMEARIRQNDNKGGWERTENSWLFGRLLYKVGMLARCVLNSEGDTTSFFQYAADMANYAMMISDNEQLLG
jgi:hypothetical protein